MVALQGQPDLPQVVLAARQPHRLAGRAHRGDDQGEQDETAEHPQGRLPPGLTPATGPVAVAPRPHPATTRTPCVQALRLVLPTACTRHELDHGPPPPAFMGHVLRITIVTGGGTECNAGGGKFDMSCGRRARWPPGLASLLSFACPPIRLLRRARGRLRSGRWYHL